MLNLVGEQADIVGLAIAEYLPWSVIKFAPRRRAPSRDVNDGADLRVLFVSLSLCDDVVLAQVLL
jgi:hypothetical protein